jgi:hypothetical protein
MRFGLMAAVVAALALPGIARAADLPAAAKSTLPSDPSAGARPAKLRPRNAVDRTSSDPSAATFSSFDSNGDGYVSREEAGESAELTRRFNALDRNRDGRLSLGEVSGWRNASYRRIASERSIPPHTPDEPGNIPPTMGSKH